MKTTVVYFHGFNGKNSKKYNIIKNYFPEYECLEFKQEYDWKVDFQQFDDLVNTRSIESLFILGSSLGSIYSIYFALKYSIRCLLINPSYFPENTLKNHLSPNNLQSFIEVKEMIETMDSKKASNLISLFLAKDDELLNFDNFIDKFNCITNIRWFNNKGHGFNNFQDNLTDVNKLICPDL